MLLGKLHLLVLHFPIALAMAAVMADIMWVIWRREMFKQAGAFCIVLAAAAIVPTVITGLVHLGYQHYEPDLAAVAELHESWGYIALTAVLLAAVVRVARQNSLHGRWLACYCLLDAAIFATISLTGHFGGQLTHGKDFLPGLL